MQWPPESHCQGQCTIRQAIQQRHARLLWRLPWRWLWKLLCRQLWRSLWTPVALLQHKKVSRNITSLCACNYRFIECFPSHNVKTSVSAYWVRVVPKSATFHEQICMKEGECGWPKCTTHLGQKMTTNKGSVQEHTLYDCVVLALGQNVCDSCSWIVWFFKIIEKERKFYKGCGE